MAKLKEGETPLLVHVNAKLKERFKRIAKRRFGLMERGVDQAMVDFVERYGRGGSIRPEVND